MARPRPSTVSLKRITDNLKVASRKGDRAALTLALDQMKTLAFSPRYWEKYLTLLRNPQARLVDLLVIKQGERIAHQKGWKLPRPVPPSAPPKALRNAGRAARRRAASPPDRQPSLFD